MTVSLTGKRAAALLEACLMIVFVVLVCWFFEAYLTGVAFWNWYFKALIALIALCAVILPRRSLKSYGFIPSSPRFTLKWSLAFIAVFILPAIVPIVVSAASGKASIVVASTLGKVSPLRIAVFFMVFVGLIEEAFFRGYVQSRLNEAFEKRWQNFLIKDWKVNYGTGLLLASALFALLHIVNYWNPLAFKWEPTSWMPLHIAFCFFGGLILGILREASGDVYVPASVHGSIMTAYTLLSIYAGGWLLFTSLFVSWFIFFLLLAPFLNQASTRNKNP